MESLENYQKNNFMLNFVTELLHKVLKIDLVGGVRLKLSKSWLNQLNPTTQDKKERCKIGIERNKPKVVNWKHHNIKIISRRINPHWHWRSCTQVLNCEQKVKVVQEDKPKNLKTLILQDGTENV